MKRRIAKVKPMNPKQRKKKAKGPELVRECDNCGKAFGDNPLGMTHARIGPSGVIAAGMGLVTRKRPDGFILFFCNEECRDNDGK